MQPIIEQICNIEGRHAAGTTPSPVMRAIARHAGNEVAASVETGSGKTTILFSRLSKNHKAFTIDDGSSDHGTAFAANSPLFDKSTVEFIYGPTQRTLPAYHFEHELDVALIDGPHAFPFPELEYFHLYPKLKPGSLFILDDIHIPNINNMYKFLREDDMFDLIEVVYTTAFFRRTSAPTFDPFGDGWPTQGYNKRRFPATTFGKVAENKLVKAVANAMQKSRAGNRIVAAATKLLK